MAWTNFQWFIILLLITTGIINTITAKFMNRTRSVGRDGVKKKFHHPFFQAWYKTISTLSCLVVYKILFCVIRRRGDGAEDEHKLTKGNRNYNVFILLIPIIFAQTATSMGFLALNLTYASSYLMLRGSVIIFIGIFSMVFLKRKIGLKQWSGITSVILGLTLVGLADYLSEGSEESLNIKEIVIGDIVLVVAQIIAATAYVIEEKLVIGLDIPPLEVVGWGGLFAFLTTSLVLIPMYFIRADRPLTQHKGDRVEDIIDAFVQIGNSWQMCVAFLCNIISLAFFNFAGVTLTKELSATTRKVLENIRIVIVWGFSLAFFGQKFHWLQLLGFCLLVFGIFLYNNVIGTHTFSICKRTGREEESNTNAEATGTK